MAGRNSSWPTTSGKTRPPRAERLCCRSRLCSSARCSYRCSAPGSGHSSARPRFGLGARSGSRISRSLALLFVARREAVLRGAVPPLPAGRRRGRRRALARPRACGRSCWRPRSCSPRSCRWWSRFPSCRRAASRHTPIADLNEDAIETVGWPELVRTVARRLRRAPTPRSSATAVVFTGNYGEAGAIDRFGPEYGLPRAYSGTTRTRASASQTARGPVIVLGYGIRRPTSQAAAGRDHRQRRRARQRGAGRDGVRVRTAAGDLGRGLARAPPPGRLSALTPPRRRGKTRVGSCSDRGGARVPDVYATDHRGGPGGAGRAGRDPRAPRRRSAAAGDARGVLLARSGSRPTRTSPKSAVVRGPSLERLPPWPGSAQWSASIPSPVFLAKARELGAESSEPHLRRRRRPRAAVRGRCPSTSVVFHTTLCHIPAPSRALARRSGCSGPAGCSRVFDGDYATTTCASATSTRSKPASRPASTISCTTAGS